MLRGPNPELALGMHNQLFTSVMSAYKEKEIGV
jgi:hypothetical protein